MRSIAFLTLLVAIGAWVVVRNLPAGDAAASGLVVAKTQEVQSISIDGSGLPLAQLRDTLTTRVGTIVDSVTLEHDRAALEAWLATRGYLAAKVAPPVVTFGPGGGAYVVFDVDRGRLFHLRTIELRGPGWRDAGVLTIASGDEALGDRLVRARQAAEDTLARHGKPIRVELELHPDHAEAALDVVLVTR